MSEIMRNVPQELYDMIVKDIADSALGLLEKLEFYERFLNKGAYSPKDFSAKKMLELLFRQLMKFKEEE